MKRGIFSILFTLALALCVSLVIALPAGAGVPTTLYVSKWTENATNPIFDPAEKAYYPTTLFDGATYRMWYADEAGIRYTTSGDGITWADGVPVTGLTPSGQANHPLVEYIDGKYMIWYWDQSVIYSINAIRYAESTDGTTWTNDQAITQVGSTVITGVNPDWNRGSYGPCDVLYNAAGSETITAPADAATVWANKFVMYYDGTTGGDEAIGLAVSADGKLWHGYNNGAAPVLAGGGGGTWDEGYASRCTVLKDGSTYHMLYSGGTTRMDHGIGHATSADGLAWMKNMNNPYLHKDDGIPWRAERTYSPMVIEDGGVYKMWFSGKDAGGNYAIGYATNTNLNAEYKTIQSAVNAASSTTINVAAGTYNESLDIGKGVSIVGSGSDEVFVTGGIQISGGNWSGLTLEGLYLSGDAPGFKDAVIDSRPTTNPVSDITIRNCVLDGQNIGTRMAFYGHYIAGNWTWEGNEIKNFANWYLIDNTSSTHDVPYKLDTVIWDSNHVHDVSGSIAFRGKITEPTDLVIVRNSTFDQYVDRSTSTGWVWACIEISNATDVRIYNNTMRDVPPQMGGGYGDEGQGLQIWSVNPWTVDIYDNTIVNNYEGILIWSLLPDSAWSGPDTPLRIPAGSIHDNNISGNTVYGLWIGDSPTVGSPSSAIGGPLDAESNWWGSANGPTHAGNTFNVGSQGDAVSDNVLYVPWYDTDMTGNPLAPVTTTNPEGSFASIQAGVTASNDNGTVNVKVGTYDEQVVINKSLTLQGAGDTTLIKPSQATADAFQLFERKETGTGNDTAPIVVATTSGATVNIQNLKIDGSLVGSVPGGASMFAGILYRDTNGLIDHVTVENIGAIYGGCGMYLVGHDTAVNVEVSYCNVSSYNKNGITANYPNITANIHHNTVTGMGPTDVSAQNGIQIGSGATGTVNNNQVSGCQWNGYDPLAEAYEDDWTAAGILVIAPNSALEISGNEVQSCDVGMDIESGTPTTITNNDVYDNSYGFVLWNANPAINYNNIYPNDLCGVYRTTGGDLTGTLDATNNWWGSVYGPEDATGTIESLAPREGGWNCDVCDLNAEPVGQVGDKVSENIDYCPWLVASVEKATGTATGTGTATFTVDNGTITGLTAVDEATLPTAGKPSGITFPHGLFSFNITGVTPPGIVTVTITLPSAAPAGTQYWKCQGGNWINCTTLLGDNDGDNVLTLTLTDGGLGDSDGAANGTIVDPGGPGTPAFVGGGGGIIPPPTTVSKVGSVSLLQYLDLQGRTRIKIILTSDDDVLTVTIFSATLVQNVGGNPLESMGIVTLSTPPPPPGYALVGHAYDCLPDGAKFAPNVTMTFAYDPADIPDGASEADLLAAYWDGDEWVNIPTTVNAAANTVTTGVGHFTPFALIAPLPPAAPAAFSVSNLSIQPAEVQPNEVVNITFSVANSGGSEGSYSVVLKINGATEAERSITLAAGESQDVSFSVTKAEAASYNVTIEGLSGSFTVVTPAAEEEAPEAGLPISWTLIWIIAAAVVAVGLIIFFAVRQRA